MASEFVEACEAVAGAGNHADEVNDLLGAKGGAHGDAEDSVAGFPLVENGDFLHEKRCQGLWRLFR